MDLPSERSAILAILPPVATTTARTSTYVKPSGYGSLRATVLLGDNSASALITLLKAADTSGGSSASVATAAFGGTATTDDNKAWVANFGYGTDFVDQTRPYFAIQLGAGPAQTAAILEGLDARYSPPTNIAAATVIR